MSTREKAEAGRVTVGSFLDKGGTRLSMKVVAGEKGLSRAISEAAINRPGLALSGFLSHFPRRRIQVIGLAEHSYLLSLDVQSRQQRLREFFGAQIPCLVVTRALGVSKEMHALATEFGVPVLRSRMITKHFVNAATIVMENLMAPQTTVQGTMVEIMGIGVLIEGRPGIGKSETALALVRRGHALVADDITCLRRDSSGSLIGSPPQVTRYHMEIRGVGIVHVPSLFGVTAVRSEKKLDMVATLCPAAECDSAGPSAGPRSREFLGVTVPQSFIPVAPGRELANVVETAALNEKLKRLGHDAEKELDEKLMAMMTAGLDTSE